MWLSLVGQARLALHVAAAVGGSPGTANESKCTDESAPLASSFPPLSPPRRRVAPQALGLCVCVCPIFPPPAFPPPAFSWFAPSCFSSCSFALAASLALRRAAVLCDASTRVSYPSLCPHCPYQPSVHSFHTTPRLPTRLPSQYTPLPAQSLDDLEDWVSTPLHRSPGPFGPHHKVEGRDELIIIRPGGGWLGWVTVDR